MNNPRGRSLQWARIKKTENGRTKRKPPAYCNHPAYVTAASNRKWPTGGDARLHLQQRLPCRFACIGVIRSTASGRSSLTARRVLRCRAGSDWNKGAGYAFLLASPPRRTVRFESGKSFGLPELPFPGLSAMKNRFPRRQELIILVTLSLLCAVVSEVSGKYDVGLAVLGAPVFLVAALMGFRRSSAPTPPTQTATAESPADAPMAGR